VSGVSDLYTADDEGVVLRVHVQPGAGRSAVVGRHGDALKLRIAAPPLDDRANRATVELVAETLDTPAKQVTIVSGERSRVKRIRIAGVEADDVELRLRRALEDAATPGGPRQRRGID
jgi:uncharacterized protein (TIGR00251 family)